MRVLVVSNLYPPNVLGGYERLCFAVTAGLAARGHEMTVLTSRHGGKLAEYPGQRVVRTLDLLASADIYTPFAGSQADRERINAGNLAAFDAALRTARPQVVFAWNLFFLDAGLLQAMERCGVRTVVMLTDNWLLVMRNGPFWTTFFNTCVLGDAEFAPPRRSMRRRLGVAWRRLAGRSLGLEAVFGAAFVRDLYAAGGVWFDRSRVVYNGVKQDGYASVKRADRTRLVMPGTLKLVFAGRLVDLKGAHTAVAAMALLDPAALGVERVVLTLVGDQQDGTYIVRLREAIAQSGRAEAIALVPAVPEDELPILFNAHDIYVFPSLYEPFSLTLIQALALGIPTVASRAGGNPEIVRDGVTGVLFRRGDAADLAAAITRLARDGGLRARVASAGAAVARGFSEERMAREMESFLMER